MSNNKFSGLDCLVWVSLDHEVKDGLVKFRIEWKGEYEHTWETLRNVPEELVSRYLAKR